MTNPIERLTEQQLEIITKAVSERVRLRRISLRMSCETLAKSLGITVQQLRKYEAGTNRLSGSRLFQLAKALFVPVSFFFELVDDTLEGRRLTSPEDISAEFVRSFEAIDNPLERTAIMALVKTLSGR